MPEDRLPISVAVVAKNEEHNLPRMLKSVSWAQEIIVIDAESSDQTVSIAEAAAAKVTVRAWPGHVEQKNFALQQCTQDWVLCLDADEVVSPQLAQEIKHIVSNTLHHVDAYFLPRQVYYLGRWIKHCGWYPDYKLRLVRRNRAHWTGQNPHDRLEVDGPTARCQADLHHYTYQDLRDHLDFINHYTTIAAQEYAKTGRKPRAYMLLVRPVFTFFKKYCLQRGFLDGRAGLIISIMASYYVFLKQAKLWELTLSNQSNRAD